MNDQPRINELLEAYRPGIDDLAEDAWQPLRAALAEDAEVQRRAEAIQRHDQVVSAAMQDVAVPAGLAERLLASLPEVESTNVLQATPPQVSDPVHLPSVAPASTRLGRRAWATAFVGAAIAVVALAVVLWPRGPSDTGHVTADQLSQMVMAWENDDSLASGWRSTPAAGLASYPIGSGDLTSSPLGVIGPKSRDDLYLAVYELSSPSGKKGRLYVAYTGRKFAVPGTPGSLLRGLTGLRQGIAWQRDEFLYVVVFNSEEASAREFVQIRDIT